MRGCPPHHNHETTTLAAMAVAPPSALSSPLALSSILAPPPRTTTTTKRCDGPCGLMKDESGYSITMWSRGANRRWTCLVRRCQAGGEEVDGDTSRRRHPKVDGGASRTPPPPPPTGDGGGRGAVRSSCCACRDPLACRELLWRWAMLADEDEGGGVVASAGARRFLGGSSRGRVRSPAPAVRRRGGWTKRDKGEKARRCLHEGRVPGPGLRWWRW